MSPREGTFLRGINLFWFAACLQPLPLAFVAMYLCLESYWPQVGIVFRTNEEIGWIAFLAMNGLAVFTYLYALYRLFLRKRFDLSPGEVTAVKIGSIFGVFNLGCFLFCGYKLLV